jgi:hypothetical protein
VAEQSSEASERLAELEAEVRDLRYRLGLLEARLELTERAESTLRESLQRERERADQAELEARQLRGMLEEARKPERPWWKRVFGP